MSFNITEWSVLGAITLVDDLPLFGVSPWWRPLVASQTSLEEGEGGSVPPLPPLSLFIIIIFFFRSNVLSFCTFQVSKRIESSSNRRFGLNPQSKGGKRLQVGAQRNQKLVTAGTNQSQPNDTDYVQRGWGVRGLITSVVCCERYPRGG